MGSNTLIDNRFFLKNAQTCPGAYPASYSMGSSGSFFRSKSAWGWSWLLTSI